MRPFLAGAVAQLIERLVRNEEVAGLNPVCSTNYLTNQAETLTRLLACVYPGKPLVARKLGALRRLHSALHAEPNDVGLYVA